MKFYNRPFRHLYRIIHEHNIYTNVASNKTEHKINYYPAEMANSINHVAFVIWMFDFTEDFWKCVCKMSK